MDEKLKILVVEDERVVAEDIQRVLEQFGYEVPALAACGEDAIKYADQFLPDLILMDIVIRGQMTGIEAAGKISEKHNIPIIYLTAYADAKTIENAKATAPFGYILKPFNNNEIQTTIEMAIYKHRMDMRLRESEAWLSTTLQSIGDGVIATDDKGNIKFVNKVALDLLEYNKDEILLKKINDVFKMVTKNEELTVPNLTYLTIQEGKTSFLKEGSFLITKNNRLIPIDGNSAPIFDSMGHVIGAVKVFRDISERLEAEKAVRESEEKYRTLFDTIAQGVLYFNEEGKITSANPAAAEILNFDQKLFYGKDLFGLNYKIFTEEGNILSSDQDPVKVCLANQLPVLNQVLGFAKHEQVFRWILVDITPQLDFTNSNLTAVVMSFTDITKRKEAELALNYRNLQLHSLVRLANEISTTLDVESVLSNALNALIENTPFTAGSILLLNKKRNEVEKEVHNSTPVKVRNILKELILDKYSHYRRSLLNKHIKIYPLKQFVQKIFTDESPKDVQKSINYCIAIPVEVDSVVSGSINLLGRMKELHNVSDDFLSSIGLQLGLSLKNAKLYSEIRETLKKLKETQEKLIQSEKLAGLGMLANNIVHEIGNPLAAIGNSIQVLQKKIKLEGKLEELMNIMSWETDRMIRIINDLREFSKPRKLNLVKSDIRDVVKKAVSVINQNVELIFGKDIKFNAPAEFPDVYIDPDSIEQVLINLIKNAVQASKEGGVVNVKLYKNGNQHNQCVIIKVQDDGEGISEENLNKIFEPYFSTKARGMGLGMHIVKINVEQHGGSIKIDSTLGKGTVVTVKLPLKRGDNGENICS
ncbi:hypothetical protein DRQ07_04855 [candidate division KSB1 bacterium]|nr:MAG: hypothetical protein DRQ07_04855 [candidate division KSB1 bacterium]